MKRRHNELLRSLAGLALALALSPLAAGTNAQAQGFEVVGRSSDQSIVSDDQIRVTEDNGVRTVTINPSTRRGGVTTISLAVRLNDSELPLAVSSQPVRESVVEETEEAPAESPEDETAIAEAAVPEEPQGDVLPVAVRDAVFTAVRVLSGGVMQLNLDGDPNLEYVIEASEDMQDWQAISIVSSPDGSMIVVDEDAPNHAKRFYRARLN